MDLPVAEWPDFALTNEVEFNDTTYSYLANAFAVDTGADPVGVTCKHIFMVFRNHGRAGSVALGDDFVGWTLRSARDSAAMLPTRRLINADPDEPIGDFSTIKGRDWQPLDPEVDPTHTSGSPVIDENGYLVGIVSGAVGRLGVVAGVPYLRWQFDRLGVAYRASE